MILTKSSSRNCKMIFIIGRGFAERQILKKWKWPYLLNWVEYFDKLLRKHWYWQDLAQEIAKWHFSLVEALPSFKFWKKVIMALSLELSGILWWNFAYTLILTRCTPWDCQMTLEIGWVFAEVKKMRLLQNDIYHQSRLCRALCLIGRGFAELQSLKKWKWPYLLNWVECFDKLLCKHWYYQDLAQEIVKCHFSSVEVLPSSKFWKSENGPISWTEWNIVMKFCIHIGILTRCSPWDCQMTFGIGRGFAEVQILKKVKINS